MRNKCIIGITGFVQKRCSLRHLVESKVLKLSSKISSPRHGLTPLAFVTELTQLSSVKY